MPHDDTSPLPFEPGRPRHEQVAEWLRDRIDSGAFSVDERLPSERELMEMFDVSRITVRRSLGTLEAEGRIYRQQGLGSFVSARRIEQGLVRLTDFAEDMRRAGMAAKSRVLHRGNEPAPPVVARELGLTPGDLVDRLDRLRIGDDEPIALDCTWLPLYYGQVLGGHDLTKETIFEILEREYEIPVLKGHFRIEAAAARDVEAKRLDIRAGDPLLRVHRTSLTLGNRPVYYQVRSYRADRVAFELQATRDSVAALPEGMRLDALEPVFDSAWSGGGGG